MAETLYRVVIKGYSSDKAEYFTDADFAKLFNISTEEANRIIGSSPQKIKENLNEAQANQYKEKIEDTGVICELEDMSSGGGLSLEDID